MRVEILRMSVLWLLFFVLFFFFFFNDPPPPDFPPFPPPAPPPPPPTPLPPPKGGGVFFIPSPPQPLFPFSLKKTHPFPLPTVLKPLRRATATCRQKRQIRVGVGASCFMQGLHRVPLRRGGNGRSLLRPLSEAPAETAGGFAIREPPPYQDQGPPASRIRC